MKKSFTSKDKAKIALVALTERDTISAVASAHGAHPTQAGLWKKKAKEELYTVFAAKTNGTSSASAYASACCIP